MVQTNDFRQPLARTGGPVTIAGAVSLDVSGAPAPVRGRIRVGTAAAGPAERGFGHIDVTLPEREHLLVPCWVIQGRPARGRVRADEPVLYVHSTQHGNEISGIEVVRRVVQTVDPRRMRGTLIALPIANPLAFHWRRHHYLQGPEEAYQARPELDVDHFWPGDPAGTHVQRLAHALWHGAVRHATHVLDMHTWNRWQAAATTVRTWHAPSLALARAFGLWVQARPDGPPATGSGAGESSQVTGSITAVAIRNGKAACAPNFTGQWDIYENEVRRGVAGLRNVMRTLGMLPGEPVGGRAWSDRDSTQAPTGDHPGSAAGQRAARWHPSRTRDGIYADPPVFSQEDLVAVDAPAAGIFLPRVQPEQRVHRGESLGTLVRLDTFRPVDVPAPIDALVYLVGAIGPGADVALPPMMPLAAAGSRLARLLPF